MGNKKLVDELFEISRAATEREVNVTYERIRDLCRLEGTTGRLELKVLLTQFETNLNTATDGAFIEMLMRRFLDQGTTFEHVRDVDYHSDAIIDEVRVAWAKSVPIEVNAVPGLPSFFDTFSTGSVKR